MAQPLATPLLQKNKRPNKRSFDRLKKNSKHRFFSYLCLMEIRHSEFVKSSASHLQCPLPDRPEFAFIGRSNVGKSSLINMLALRKNLAKISGTPGKTQTINHFLINRSWYLVDLPGYGYASAGKAAREAWGQMIEEYLLLRTNLQCVFALIDSRLKPQKIDLEFIDWLGKKEIPFAILLTKTDKVKAQPLVAARKLYEAALLQTWETLPPIFNTSSDNKTGRLEILKYISDILPKKLKK